MINLKNKQIKFHWTEMIIIGALICLAVWEYIKKRNLDSNPVYTKGIITGTREGVKGSVYLNFEFYVKNEKVISWTPLYKGWKVGDTVIIKYNQSDPHSNNVLKTMPEGESLRPE